MPACAGIGGPNAFCLRQDGTRQCGGAALVRRPLARVARFAGAGARACLSECPDMIRWLLVVFVALVLINSATPWLRRMGLGRLPGDFQFQFFGRPVFVPLASTVLVSVLVSLLVRWW